MKNYRRFVAICVIILFGIAFSGQCASDELLPLKVIVNTLDKGEFVVLYRSDGSILFDVNDFQELGINFDGATDRINGSSYINLAAFSDAIKIKLDDVNLALNLEVEPGLLKKTELDLIEEEHFSKNSFGIDSAILNYGFINRGNTEASNQIYEIPLETVLSVHDMLVQSNYTYYYDGLQSYWSRGMTNVTRDFTSQLTRLVIGDFAASSGELGGSGIFLGLSYQKKYSMANRFTKFPSIYVTGTAKTPSKIRMYVNDALISEQEIDPGEYEIRNLPNLYGAGSVQIEVEDVFGRIEEKNLPYYVSTRILREGLHDYSYNVGFRRDSLIVPNPKYEPDLTFMGFHRYGFHRYFSAGLRFDLSRKKSNVGPVANWVVGRFGEMEAGAAISDNDSEKGSATFFRYTFTSRYFHARYAIRQQNRNYFSSSPILDDNVLRQTQAMGIGIHGLPYGSLAFNYSRADYYLQKSIENYSVIYSVRLAKRISLLIRGTETRDEDGFHPTIFVSLNAVLGHQRSINGSYIRQDKTSDSALNYQKSVPVGEGLGYRLQARQIGNGTTNNSSLGDVSAQYKSRRFVLTGDYFMSDNGDNYQAQLLGSMSYINDGFYLSRPIQDSFGLVKVGELDDVRVYYSNELIGKTRSGELLLPNLISYADNAVSIDPKDIPVDRSLTQTYYVVSPSFRTGSVANFDVDKFQGYFGYVFVNRKNQKTSADYARITLTGPGETLESLIGKGGEFYFENLKKGIYQAMVDLDGKRCQFDLKIKQNQEMMVNLGEYFCR